MDTKNIIERLQEETRITREETKKIKEGTRALWEENQKFETAG